MKSKTNQEFPGLADELPDAEKSTLHSSLHPSTRLLAFKSKVCKCTYVEQKNSAVMEGKKEHMTTKNDMDQPH